MATITPSAPLEQAVTLMAKRDLAHLLVAEPGGGWPSLIRKNGATVASSVSVRNLSVFSAP